MRSLKLIAMIAALLAAACQKSSDKAPADGSSGAALDFHHPDASFATQAPDSFRARFSTTKGDFVIAVHRAWAPLGADRFYNLVRSGYYDGVRFFRVIPGFMAQFGIHGDPALNSVWREATIPDDPVQQSNKRGYVTFATAGPNTRTTQVFINFADKNTTLDSQGFAPFGKVVEGMEVVNKLFSGYGEAAPKGHGPDQNRLQKEGNTYLTKSFPKLDSIKKASIEPAGP
jgi:cyclophilin family peptidyl-prolyl cis-trans isomerase